MQQHIVAQPEEFNIEATTPCSPTSEEYNHEYDVNMSQEVSMETDSSRIAHPYDDIDKLVIDLGVQQNQVATYTINHFLSG